MQKTYFIAIFSLLFFQLNAQNLDTLNRETAPIGGIDALALNYFRIDFSKAQRKEIAGVELEFIFQIDETGNPTLEEVNGTNNAVIIDSLKSITPKLQQFYPALENGVPRSSLYFMQLTFPRYKVTDRQIGMEQSYVYNRAKLEDFEYIHKSKQRFDVLFSGMTNHFLGEPANYLGLGFGMKIDMTFATKKSYLYGFTMNVYSNKSKKDFPSASLLNREQLSTPTLGLFGVVFGKWFDKVNIQAEVNFGVQNITEKMGDNDPEWVQFKGWSPGLVVNYPIKLGKDIPSSTFFEPTILNHQLNLHLGLRAIFLSEKEASGPMIEFGVGYRMTTFGVDGYKLKSD